MNSQIFSRKLTFGLFGLWSLSSVGIAPVFADECTLTDAATLESCKDKNVKASGPRIGMFEVPEYFMMADPSMTGGEGLQDYMSVGDLQIIIHTNDEVQCDDLDNEIEVKGSLQQMDLEEGKAWVITVTKFKCL
ncbi:hypothetical protein [Candidatus Parabeggiatoa sp. HSG14]|uniref:hypothetical protein n=1 Tax=Candidatus Parabeggiatoa sp. HSG14 TaxID=3055593 RepID=UPI0025A821C9|nr:hypothetical protein [Thiotrichales bacterium HSG14]